MMFRPLTTIKPIIERFPAMAMIYRNIRDQFDFLKKPVETQWGFSLAGNRSMAQGTFEPLETEIIRKLLIDVDVFVNVGANIGYYCCHALSMGKQVIAFEPIHRNVRYLCQNLKVNGWTSAEIYPIALSNNVGLIDIYGGDTGASILKGWAGVSENYKMTVPSSTMDVVLGSRLNGKKILVLVDVEGAEKLVLDKATQLLINNPKPIWMIEITKEEHRPVSIKANPDFKSIFQLFLLNGYEAFSVSETMRPVRMEQVELAAQGSFQFGTYNFLFR
jgi:FkbM family methyltransferase